jgi:3',5'-cyclic AMP phosphodiesterase CpdA
MAQRLLFVIMPFGVRSLESGEYDFDAFYRSVLRPTGVEAGYEVLRIDEIVDTGIITDQVFKYLVNADVVIADVSYPNGNVYYELGVRQAVASGQTILVAKQGTELPFDIAAQRVLLYNADYQSDFEFVTNLRRAISADISDPTNRVRSALESMGLASSPSSNQVRFEQDFSYKIDRARGVEQLVAIWHWAKNFRPLPTSGLLALAAKLAEAGDFATASDVLLASYPEAENDYEVHRQRGFYLRKLDAYEDAKQEFLRALELNPNDPETLGMLGGLLKREGDLKGALNYYRQGSKLAPSSLYLRVAYAGTAILANPDDRQSGLNLYAQLYEELVGDPTVVGNFWAELVRAEAAWALGNDVEARSYVQKAISNGAGSVELQSCAEQVSLLGKAGLRKSEAEEFASVLFAASRGVETLQEIPEVPASTVWQDAPPGSPKLIFHLSDIHFGFKQPAGSPPLNMHRFADTENTRRLSLEMIDEIDRALKMASASPKDIVVVVSGDLTYSGSRTEFLLVESFLREICDKFGLERTQVVLVPGNHDVNWAAAKQDITYRFDDYLGFVRKFYGEELFHQRFPLVDWDFEVTSDRPKANQMVYVSTHGAVTFVGLNTCVFEDDQNHYGFVGKAQLEKIKSLLPSPAGLRFAVMHHHLLPYPEPLEPRNATDVFIDISTVRDAGLVERRLERLGFSLVMHGHKHKPQFRESMVWDRLDVVDSPRPLLISGCGSTGVCKSELEHSQSNHYALIELLRPLRQPGAEFLRVEWREFSLAADPEWATTERRTVMG